MYDTYFQGNEVTRWRIRHPAQTDAYEMYLDTGEHQDVKAGVLEFPWGSSGRVHLHSETYPEVYVEQDVVEGSERKIVLQSHDLAFYCIIVII